MIQELLQVDIHDGRVSSQDVFLSLLHGLMLAARGTESVAVSGERRIEALLQDLRAGHKNIIAGIEKDQKLDDSTETKLKVLVETLVKRFA